MVKRYDLVIKRSGRYGLKSDKIISRKDNGNYVHLSDYTTLEAQLATERAAHAQTMQERDELKADIDSYAEASSNLATELYKTEARLAEALKALEEIAPGWREAIHFMRNNAMDLARDYPEVVAADEAFRRVLEGGE